MTMHEAYHPRDDIDRFCQDKKEEEASSVLMIKCIITKTQGMNSKAQRLINYGGK